MQLNSINLKVIRKKPGKLSMKLEARENKILRPEGGGGGKSFKKPKKLLFPKSIHFLTREILLALIYLQLLNFFL